jgi:single-strand DNA-binding protein
MPSSNATAGATSKSTTNASTTSAASSPEAPPVCTNLVVLRGVVNGDVVERTLPSGSVAVQFDVRTPSVPSNSVNVSWIDPPADARASVVVPGEEVVVIGTVQRRFFRVGGATQSRTEVVVDHVIPARRARSVRSAIAAATRSLGD